MTLGKVLPHPLLLSFQQYLCPLTSPLAEHSDADSFFFLTGVFKTTPVFLQIYFQKHLANAGGKKNQSMVSNLLA